DAFQPRIHHDDAVANTDLRRGEADAILGVHRLEHVVDERTQLRRHLLDRAHLLAQHTIAQQPYLPHHLHVVSAEPPVTTRAILARTMTRRVFSAVLSVTRSSARCTTVPMMPPSVTTSSPFLTAEIISWCFCWI